MTKNNQGTETHARYMRGIAFVLVALAFFTVPVLAAGVPFNNTTTYTTMLPSFKLSNLMLDNTLKWNGSIMAGANYVNRTYLGANIYGLNMTSGTANMRQNLSASATRQFAENSTSANGTVGLWAFFYNDSNTNLFLLKYGAGTPNMIWQQEWNGTTNRWRYELINSTGSSQFPTSGMTPPIMTPVLLVLTSDGSYNFQPYMCAYGGSAQSGSSTTVPGGRLRSSSQDALIWGSDGSTPLNGELYGVFQTNFTMSARQVQILCELGPNFAQDVVNITVNYTAASGVVKSTDGSNWHTGFMLSNVTVQWNNFSGRLDCNGDGSEDCSITQAFAAQMRLLAENFTSANGVYRGEFSLESVYNSSGSLRACSQSDYGSPCFQLALNAYAFAQGKKVRWQTTYMPSFLADNTNGYCTTTSSNRTCPPVNYTTWGQFVKNYSEIICGPFVYPDGSSVCEFEVWNEHDLTNFWLNNVSSRTGAVFRNATLNLHVALWNGLKNSSYASIRNADIWMSPVADANDSTATSVRRNTMTDLHAAGYDGFKVPFHFYLYAWANFGRGYYSLQYALNLVQADCTTYYVPCADSSVDEWGTYNASNQNATLDSYGWKSNQADISDLLHYFKNQQNQVLENNFFQAAQWGNYSVNNSEYPRLMSTVNHPQLNSQVYLTPYDPLWRFSRYHPNGSALYTCTTGDYYLDCTQTKNNTEYVITLTNTGDADRTSVNLLLSGVAAGALVNVRNGASFTVTSGVVSVTDFPAKTSNTYLFTLSTVGINTTSPAQSMSIKEPGNLNFTVTLNNSNNVSVTSVWRLNSTIIGACTGLTCTLFGNYTSQGNWTVSYNGTDGVTNFGYTWNVQVNNTDATGPTVTVVSPTATSYSTTNISVNFNATDSESSVSSLWYACDGGANVTFTAPTYATFTETTHVCVFYANDTAGNIGSDAVVFTVDTTPSSASCSQTAIDSAINFTPYLLLLFLVFSVIGGLIGAVTSGEALMGTLAGAGSLVALAFLMLLAQVVISCI